VDLTKDEQLDEELGGKSLVNLDWITLLKAVS